MDPKASLSAMMADKRLDLSRASSAGDLMSVMTATSTVDLETLSLGVVVGFWKLGPEVPVSFQGKAPSLSSDVLN